MPDSSVKTILEVKDLCIKFPRHGDVNGVDHVNDAVRPHQTMCLVGESGLVQSINALTIMGLLDSRAIVSGQILCQGTALLKMTPQERNDLRGPEIAMIYPDALSSL